MKKGMKYGFIKYIQTKTQAEKWTANFRRKIPNRPERRAEIKGIKSVARGYSLRVLWAVSRSGMVFIYAN